VVAVIERQIAEQNPVREREYLAFTPSERQRDHRGRREPWILEQRAQSEAQILEQVHV
jgi:hypothetical protein